MSKNNTVVSHNYSTENDCCREKKLITSVIFMYKYSTITLVGDLFNYCTTENKIILTNAKAQQPST